MNDRGLLASYLMSPLSKSTSQFRLVKIFSSNRVNGLLKKTTIPFILHDNLLKIRDIGVVFELKGYLLKMITNKNHKVDLASLAEIFMILQKNAFRFRRYR